MHTHTLQNVVHLFEVVVVPGAPTIVESTTILAELGGTHSHLFDVPATRTSDATTEDVMPYIQLLVCKKD